MLLGPPGSGKSTIGAALAAFGYRWREWEPVLLARWNTIENFLDNKAQALAEHQAEVAAFIRGSGPPAVFETTGISDAPFLDALASEVSLFVVRLDVTLEEALRRIAARLGGQHLTDELERNRATWEAFYRLVAPHRPTNLVIDTATTSPSEAAARIDRAFTLAGE